MNIEKANIRKKLIELRDSIDEIDRNEKSMKIAERLKELDAVRSAGLIMCYINFRSEVITSDFIRYCLNIGRRIAIPVILKTEDRTRYMISSEIYNIDIGLAPGTFGIREPEKELLKEVNPAEIDVVIAPGVGFDEKKHRIGYGAGFYDRFLPRIRPDCCKIGIAFEVQVMKELPVEGYDVNMDMVATENRIIL